ncbi:DNA translocase FtsK [Bacillus sp. Marseille-Q1617]|uniref:DNA translocase FtsK n=1 Tax=Bacillus sp. Marseille-Q1617 TaxID=2736887 RepID=UPI0020CA909F|nr:DNA translocase FtsK [Bacillus sp. Marseille-Q1617]
MSWIKKIMNKLSDQDEPIEEYYEEEVEESEPRSEKRIFNNKVLNHSRNVEARMTYQYPKGNFRFPLISDGENVNEPRPSRKRREPEQKEKQETKREEVRGIERKPRKSQLQKSTYSEKASPERTKSIERQTEKNNKNVKTKKVEKGNSRPFRPTEIPSPIYGFRTRPVKPVEKTEVEYELKEFLHNGEAVKEEKHDVYPPEVEKVNEVIEESRSQNRAGVEASLIGNEFSFKENGSEHVVGEQSEQNQGAAETFQSEQHQEAAETSTEEDMTSVPGAHSPAAAQQESPETASFTEEEAPVNKETFESHDSSDVLSIREENTAQAEGGKAPESGERQVLKSVTPDQPEVSIDEQESEYPDQPIKTQEVQPQLNNGKVQEEERKPRKRSHLPFNVLMLKQDKRQMNQRHRTNGIQERKPAHTSLPNREERRQTVPVQQGQVQNSSAGLENESANDGQTASGGTVTSVQSVPNPTAERQEAVVETQSPLYERNAQEQAVSESRTDNQVGNQSNKVQGEEAVKSYSELTSSVKSTKGYTFPEMDYLMPPVSKKLSGEWLESQKNLLDETLHNFNVRAKVVNVTQGPSVTRFEVQPEPGVKVNKITNLADDIKLSLAAKDIRIEAPIPGKHTIGIEVPNRESRPVCISEVIASPAFQESESALTAALGLDISGQPIVTDLSKMPHGLIAGATGSGKSVCINSILVSLLYKASPDELKLLLIDPKMVELAPYNRIPHLVSPVITDVKAATAALKWAVEEMERRYELFAHTGVRDIKRFNELAKRNKQYNDTLPYMVIVIDELADLMMMSPADVEEAICRIAQKARACGIHLIIATQRPSVDVITGLIKANVPTRVAFSVSSGVDSRTIIDGSGAERLLGKGDMLFLENGSSKPVRLQGTFVSDDEIDEIIHHVREQREPDYIFQQDELIKKAQVTEEEDELFFEACEFVIDQGGASASSLQRRFRIGYNRAARLMEMMEKSGVISESRGSKPRDVLISESELETLA